MGMLANEAASDFTSKYNVWREDIAEITQRLLTTLQATARLIAAVDEPEENWSKASLPLNCPEPVFPASVGTARRMAAFWIHHEYRAMREAGNKSCGILFDDQHYVVNEEKKKETAWGIIFRQYGDRPVESGPFVTACAHESVNLIRMNAEMRFISTMSKRAGLKDPFEFTPADLEPHIDSIRQSFRHAKLPEIDLVQLAAIMEKESAWVKHHARPRPESLPPSAQGKLFLRMNSLLNSLRHQVHPHLPQDHRTAEVLENIYADIRKIHGELIVEFIPRNKFDQLPTPENIDTPLQAIPLLEAYRTSLGTHLFPINEKTATRPRGRGGRKRIGERRSDPTEALKERVYANLKSLWLEGMAEAQISASLKKPEQKQLFDDVSKLLNLKPKTHRGKPRNHKHIIHSALATLTAQERSARQQKTRAPRVSC